MDLFQKNSNLETSISIIGLGYVGLPLAVEFSKKFNVVGFDLNKEKIKLYKAGCDPTNEVGDNEVLLSNVLYTSEESKLIDCKMHIICVPTPINSDKTPNLTPIIEASKIVGRNLQRGAIVVYESTVYPGTTEEICIPILEKESNLNFGQDFTVGYSPERINPGDKVHRLKNIVKVVSGSDDYTLDVISKVYKSIIEAGIYKAPSIKVAEAAKVIENSQRDINIAFMNELAMVFNKMDIDTVEVLKAANTKWNFLDFKPGLVGGHCIGVDPYYFIYKAEQLGYHSQIIAAGRKINDGMGQYIANNIIKQMIKAEYQIKGAKVAILGLTFKENCGDIRNSKVIDIIRELEDYGLEISVYDPLAQKQEVEKEYTIKLVDFDSIKEMDAIVLAVPHDIFLENYSPSTYKVFLKESSKLIVDVKGALDKESYLEKGFNYWRL
ncbi:UDP-N-acetyl-D-galactosamine dehydrogenase [Lysinibacillus sp. KCTC 33748]|uniref:nucleotide sugar dehydrogenase n=1 Tax=unclassified Lysinibacillus TaxID=2636778 RepID=UPI0009A6A480|nr:MULTISPECIES: nucleotide sugar dehydrogenase [unclassified Lysinibacillus]OXS77034.1 UDP-N-acetyl-D-galactosamine dehydrogenase [Lysinibacillus sp. KCTC 33748]SKB29059.1 UDP-N-acetyl-D-galactosamine dehydrogenase [Lysinibacillus sp. AC-3]